MEPVYLNVLNIFEFADKTPIDIIVVDWLHDNTRTYTGNFGRLKICLLDYHQRLAVFFFLRRPLFD